MGLRSPREGRCPTEDTYSYYLNGEPDESDVHFTVAPTGHGDNDFTTFHITVGIEGSNVGIWYNRGVFSNVNTRNLPSDEARVFDARWRADQTKFDQTAAIREPDRRTVGG